MIETKPFNLSKWQVMKAFELVKATAGAAGVDKFKPLRHHKYRAILFMENIALQQPHIVAHWRMEMIGAFA